MKSSENYRRGEIYYADLDPIVGSEQGGVRPVLIIQNDAGNTFSPTLIVAPLTSRVNSKRMQPTHYLVPESCALPRPSIVLLEQLRTIDKQRIRSYVGRLERSQMMCVDLKILISLGLSYLLQKS